MQNSTFTEDYRQLHELAVFCYNVASTTLAVAPPTRQTQRALVDLLIPAIASRSFPISKEFLANEVMLRDESLLGPWRASPDQLAWLMVHEELSSFFVRFALHHWKPEPFLVHHVPKAAGTSVNALLREQGWFVTFPQDSFEAMTDSNGSMGFASQVVTFEKWFRHDRIYIGGHYNLPNMVRTLKLFGRCQGVTLCRAPIDIMSSAVRYIWTRIERGDKGFAALYGVEGMGGAEMSWLRKTMGASAPIKQRVAELIAAIMNSPQFRAEYDEIFVKYFYNHEIETPELLAEYVAECGTLFAALDLANDEAATLAALHVSGTLPHANVSSFPEHQLFDAMGGEDRFAAIAAPRMAESTRIFSALAGLRAL